MRLHSVALGGVGEKGFLAPHPQMRVQCLHPLVRSGLHHRAPTTLQRFLQQARQNLFQRSLGEMVEQNLGHGVWIGAYFS